MGAMRARIAAALIALASVAAAPAARIGVEMPAAGDDGARGLAAVTAIRLALEPERVVVRDSANGGFQNPHRDEGSDNDVDRRLAPSIVAAFAGDPSIVAAIGGLRRNVGDADAAAAQAHGLPFIVLSRWTRNGRNAGVFCLCLSPPRLVGRARDFARYRFGPRLLLVLVGDAGMLPGLWPHRFDGLSVVRVEATARSADAARRRALGMDGVIVLADERPPTLWSGTAFRSGFDEAYLRRLGHRDFRAVPEGMPRGRVATLEELLPATSRLRFSVRFHAIAGFAPNNEVAAAHAAAQILRAAGSDRAAVVHALQNRRFETVIGSVSFDADGYQATAVLAAMP
jgi:hypothetical protein